MFPLSCIISACILYYCNMVWWAWWDWEVSGWLTTLLQCFDTAGWVIRPVKNLVPRMTYTMLSGTLLNLTQSDPKLEQYFGSGFQTSCESDGSVSNIPGAGRHSVTGRSSLWWKESCVEYSAEPNIWQVLPLLLSLNWSCCVGFDKLKAVSWQQMFWSSQVPCLRPRYTHNWWGNAEGHTYWKNKQPVKGQVKEWLQDLACRAVKLAY